MAAKRTAVAAQDHAEAQDAERTEAGERPGPCAHRQRRGAAQPHLRQARRARGAGPPASRKRSAIRSAARPRRRETREQERLETERRENERLEAENRRRVEEEQNRKKAQEEARRARRAAGRARRPSGASATAAPRPGPRGRRSRAKAAPSPEAARPSPVRSQVPTDKHAPTRYGRQELHVAGDVSNRYKKKRRVKGRTVVAGADARHAFEMPTAPQKRREVALGETDHGGGAGAEDGHQGDRGHQGADEHRHHGDDQPAAGPGDRGARGRGTGPHCQTAAREIRSRTTCRAPPPARTPASRGRRSSPSWATSITARPHCSITSARQGGGRRGRWHHPAHRRLSGADSQGRDHLPGYAGPCGIHRDARPRRQGHRCGDPGRGGR